MENMNIAVLIPACNEEKVLSKTLEALIKIIPRSQLYIVNDCSTDNTRRIAEEYTENVLNLNYRSGKAGALNLAIDYFNLGRKYNYILPLDADTIISRRFLEEASSLFASDRQGKIVAIVGRVCGRDVNWVTLYRIWEYEITHLIHKSAQDILGVITVCSGCATIYRSRIMTTVGFPAGTLTEDMDLTFLIHRQKLGRVCYLKNAYVITQDPATLRDYIKQINRWYTGFWQCIGKYDIPWQGQKLDGELTLLATDGLFSGLISVGLFIFCLLMFFQEPTLVYRIMAIDFLFFLLPTLLWTIKKYRKLKIILFIPHFYLLRFVSSILFLGCFFRYLFGFDRIMDWNKVGRYKIDF